MKQINKIDFSVGVAIILGSLYFFLVSQKLPQEISRIPGPAVFPQIILILLGILGGLTIISSFSRKNTPVINEAKNGKKERQSIRKISVFIIFIILYALSVRAGLFIYVTPIFIFFSIWILLKFVSKPIPYGQLVLISSVLSAALYVAFIKILRVPLQ